jgi:cysteine desulfuration protein SufE
MTEMTHTIPPRLREIIEDFQWSEGREKLELLLDFSERMPPLPDWLVGERDQMEQIHECMTPVLVRAVIQDGRMSFYFDVPAESPTVSGYAAILAEGLQGATPQEILSIPGDFYQEMGLDKVLSSQRLNGISAILAHVKRLALEAMNQTNQ